MPTQVYGLLKISGVDAKKLLQGQLTCNVENINTTHSTLGAHCNPQGRVISFFNLFFRDNAYYLLMLRSMVPIALTALKKYALFYKTELADVSESEMSLFANAEFYFDINKGVPQIYPETSGKFLPHELNLHELNAISFNKGCYTGQEIIARMHYRGKLKKHAQLFTIPTADFPMANLMPGSDFNYRSTDKEMITGVIIDARKENELYRVLLLTEDKTRE